MKILVTGGAGYIGSVMCTRLLEEGHEVVVLDDISQGHESSIPDGVSRFIHADIRDIAKVLKPEDNIEAVIHLAAFIAAGESMAKPELYWQNNTVGTLTMLDGLRTLGIRKLVFASSAAVYGNPVSTPIEEDAPKNPTNTYGMTKLAMDMAITSECVAHGMAATSLRFFNVAGAYRGKGELHPVETHIIPIALQVAKGERAIFSIFGDDYPTKDGTCVRDYIHVVDLANAAILALEKLTAGKHAIYNLGNGDGFSNREVIAAVEKVTGKEMPTEVSPRREGDPAVLIASSQKAHKELGWTPSKPALDEMVADAWEFINQKTA
ncbi:MAG TPA: UDP-glucose 4-epimerase GalE [Candidatus Saccharimonadales bacterium]|nr:UDP-glucose 4-epimerase GalE [Candidatus Saccharimonadales bacterium]